MTEKQWVAGTVMARNEEGKYVFLVKNELEGYSFPATRMHEGKTGLASIIDEIKEKLAIEAASLYLYELTNAVFRDQRIPLFVFELRDDETAAKDRVIKDENQLYSWQHSSVLTQTLSDWEISGVPQF